MHLLDEYVSRQIAPAQAYRSDLLQILELHTKLRDTDRALRAPEGHDIEPGSMLDLAGFAITQTDPAGISPDPVWSRVRHGNDGATPTNLETIMSVIDDLDVDGTSMFGTAMLDEDWMLELDNSWLPL